MVRIRDIEVPIHVSVPQHARIWPLKPERVQKHVESHDTEQLLTHENDWTFTRVQTGCIRVQKGDFTAYLSEEEADALGDFIRDTARRD